jgi:RNA polymerase sigma-70 factor (ECF subfamily)
MNAHAARKDTELITSILSGDMRAMETLMRLHNRTLYRTARAILGDDGEAEDAVQEAYLRAYRALGTFRGESKLSTWLVRITANEALMRRRRNPRPAEAFAHEEAVSERPGPQEDAERAQMRRLLESHIDALPDPYRAVFVLRAVEEFNVPETAAALGIPEATVRTRYFRARALMRDWVRGQIGTTAEAFAFAGARCDRIVNAVLTGVAGVLAAMTIAACSEKPPRTNPEPESVYNHEQTDQNLLRDRTVHQGESGRMSY